MDEKKSKLKKMAVWTITIFGAILAVSFAVLWLLLQSGSKIATLGRVFANGGWIVLVIDLVLCGGVYIAYSLILNRKK